MSEILLKNVNNNNNNNNNKWYTHVPKPIYEEGDVTVLWNQEVYTEKLQQIGQI